MTMRWALSLFVIVLLAACDKGSQRADPSAPVASVTMLKIEPSDPFADLASSKAVVLIFITTDCPISNRYAPEMNRLRERFSSLGVRFWRVYSDASITYEAMVKHGTEYAYKMPGVLDAKHALANRAKAEITPEAAVFLPNGELAYHGRIDDRYVSFGKARPEPTRRDLEEVLTDILAGRPVTNTLQKAIGCYIPKEQ